LPGWQAGNFQNIFIQEFGESRLSVSLYFHWATLSILLQPNPCMPCSHMEKENVSQNRNMPVVAGKPAYCMQQLMARFLSQMAVK
jgi:hypothetical protein